MHTLGAPDVKRRLLMCVAASVALAACSSEQAAVTSVDSTVASTSTSSSTTTSTTVAPTTTSTSTTTSTTTTTTTSTSTTPSTTTPTTAPPAVPAAPTVPTLPPLPVLDALSFPTDTEIQIGSSVEGRPITVIRRGTPGGTRVLAVGAIHGNEAAGVAIIDRLAVDPVPEGVELWLVRSMNPDGQAKSDRQNAHAVDLNRNFPEKWDVLGTPGDWQYGGVGPASEPETQTMVALGQEIRPDIILWYHQDLFRIAPGTGRSGEIRTRYAELAGLPIVDITGGTYTGTASQWSRTVIPEQGVGITVELGPTLSDAEVIAHVTAVHTIAVEFF
jgi:protein MpaA